MYLLKIIFKLYPKISTIRVNRVINLKSITPKSANIKSVYAVKSRLPLKWKWDDGHLEVDLPNENNTENDVKAFAIMVLL